MQQPIKSTMRYLKARETKARGVSLKLWNSVPGLVPLFVISCTCGGQYLKLKSPTGIAVTVFRCDKCSNDIEILTKK